MIVAVTITYNSHADGILEPFLASVRGQTGCDWHLVIIDNDSRDGTPEYLRQIDDPRITVVLNESNVGFAAGCNQGFEIARGKGATSVLFINNDTEFPPDLFAGLEDRLLSSGAAAVSPVIVFHDRPERIWYGGGHFSFLRGFINVHDHYEDRVSVLGPHPFDTGFAPGCCLLIDADAFEQLGQFDPAFFVYCEDADLCLRIKQSGGRVIVDPGLILYHRASTSTGGPNSDFSISQISKNQMILARKHYGWAGLGLAAALTTVKTFAAILVGRITLRQAGKRFSAAIKGMRYRVPKTRAR